MQRTILLILGSALAVFLFIVATQSLNGQNTWICRDGQLVEVGKSIFPRPSYECPKPTVSPTPANEKK